MVVVLWFLPLNALWLLSVNAFSQCLDLVVLKISKYYKGQEWVSENMDYNSGMLLNSCHLGEINSLCLNFMLFMKTEKSTRYYHFIHNKRNIVFYFTISTHLALRSFSKSRLSLSNNQDILWGNGEFYPIKNNGQSHIWTILNHGGYIYQFILSLIIFLKIL